MKPVKVSGEVVRTLEASSESARPDHRRSKGLDTEARCGHLMDNLFDTGFEFTVELKPKWGWECLEERSCKFCRLQTTRPYTVGDYCPVDLFSKDSQRIAKSIGSIFKTKRNQLRVSRNGKSCADPPPELQTRLASILSTDPILSRISQVQWQLYTEYKNICMDHAKNESDYIIMLQQQLELHSFNELSSFLLAISLEDISLAISFDMDHPDAWSIQIIDIDIKLPTKLGQYLADHDWSQR